MTEPYVYANLSNEEVLAHLLVRYIRGEVPDA